MFFNTLKHFIHNALCLNKDDINNRSQFKKLQLYVVTYVLYSQITPLNLLSCTRTYIKVTFGAYNCCSLHVQLQLNYTLTTSPPSHVWVLSYLYPAKNVCTESVSAIKQENFCMCTLDF